MTDLRVFIVADDPLARTGLAAMLGDQPPIVVVGQSASDSAQMSIQDVYRPDAVVWDLGWEPTLALDLLSELPEGGPPVVALLQNADQVAEARAAGARGLMVRDAPGGDLRAALIGVTQGLTVVANEFSATLLPFSGPAPSAPHQELTSREMDVLHLLAEGLPNKVIASRLGISDHTVKFHLAATMGKLGAQSRTEAVTRATRSGLILL